MSARAAPKAWGGKGVPRSLHLQLKTRLDLEFIHRVNSMIGAGFLSV